jgi:formate dehydrogenase subunit gamma
MQPAEGRVVRFDGVERAIHWCNATLFLTLMFTGATFYFSPLSTTIAHREEMKTIHVYAGLLLPIPLLLGVLLPAGRAFRRDLSRLNRWTTDDRRWWSRRVRGRVQLGKFNPGQKLNAVFVGAVIVVMLLTGSVMRWPDTFALHHDDWRRGATFVHDWTFIALGVVVIGHILIALRSPESMQSMLRGSVSERFARREWPRWWAEEVGAGSAQTAGDVEAGAHERLGERGRSAREVTVGDVVDGRAGDGPGVREL